MLKFVVVLTIIALTLTAIPNTFGEIELPPLVLECVEDFKNLLPKGAKVESECREKHSVGGERDFEGYHRCIEEFENTSEVANFMAKCAIAEDDLTEPQNEELGNRYREILRKFQTNKNDTQN